MFFDEEFYPTPSKVIQKMLKPFLVNGYHGDYYDLNKYSILEPSAGNGAILDHINEVNGRSRKLNNFHCVEINQESQYILKEKGYKIVGNDFLTYTTDYYYNLILMNPPFSNGDEHLLRAWEILEEGQIVCLLNSETINNPYTKRRELLIKIIKESGTTEELGNCFSDAERTTNVNVTLVRLTKKPKVKKLDFTFDSVGSASKTENIGDFNYQNPMAVKDKIGNMITQFSKVKEHYIEFLKHKQAIEFYSIGLSDKKINFLDMLKELDFSSNQNAYNGMVDSYKSKMWNLALNNSDIKKYMTADVRNNFNEFLGQQSSYDFNKQNVYSVINMIFDNRFNILEKAVESLFDTFTAFYKENRLIVEGWKTNDKFKVNRKVILPYFLGKSFSGYYETYRKYDTYDDIDRVMCYLTGKDYNLFDKPIKEYDYSVKDKDKEYEMLSLKRAVDKTKVGDSSRQESEFFWFRCYKKGTLHIEFKDKNLWEEFNLRACAGKQWLPETDMKNYEDLINRKKEEQNIKQFLLN